MIAISISPSRVAFCCLFQGRRDLFNGLRIADHADWAWQEHPVILLDFNGISHDNPENLRISLARTLANIAKDNDLPSDAPLIKNQFKELIVALRQKTGRSVVILIDEYDKPLIDHLGKGEAGMNIAKANRETLKQFFWVIKDGDVADALRFVFITGVSKFSRVSIFSELNNLEDITMVDEYADMLGYTQEEVAAYFNPYIERMAEKWRVSDVQIAYQLRTYPNQEVKTAFLENLLYAYTQGLRESSRFVLLGKHLLLEDLPAFMETITAIFKAIAYTLEVRRDEVYFHTIFYLMVSASWVDARSEVLTCDGRIDLVVYAGDKIYIIEFKCNQSADAALRQIRDKGYPLAYRRTGKQILLMGINFDTE